MPISADAAIRVSYRSCAVAYAAAAAKYEIARNRRNNIREQIAQNQADGEPTKKRRMRLYAGWRNLCTMLDYAMRLYDERGRAGPPEDTSLKLRLEALWVSRGNLVANLPDYDYLSGLQMARTTTFDTADPGNSRFNTWSTNFTDNTNTLFDSADPPRRQFLDVFDTAVEDLWREEAWRRYVDSEVRRNQFTAAQRNDWDDIITRTGEYFVHSNRCMYTIADIMDLHDNEASNNHPARVAQYAWQESGPTPNSLLALGGLYAANRNDIPPTWRGRIERFDVLFE